MTEPAWEKSDQSTSPKSSSKLERYKFIGGGLLLLVAVGYLVVTGTLFNRQYFTTVAELVNNPEYGRELRVSGAVIGDSIQHNGGTLVFTIAHVPQETQNLALTLHEAVTNPVTTLTVYYEGADPGLKDEAQAILTGTLQEDGTFRATELLLKCPSRYAEELPDQVEGEGS